MLMCVKTATQLHKSGVEATLEEVTLVVSSCCSLTMNLARFNRWDQMKLGPL